MDSSRCTIREIDPFVSRALPEIFHHPLSSMLRVAFSIPWPSGKLLPIWLMVFMSALFPVVAHGQLGARLSGYLEHQYSATHTENEWSQVDYDRFRVDVDARAGRNSRASAGFVWQLYRGDTRVELRSLLPDDLAQLVDTVSFNVTNQQYLNHAYVTLRPGRIEITAGKQYLTWGAGWAFNPTELFRPKNLLEPTYEREGVGAVSARVPLGKLSDVLVGLVPEGGFSTSGKLLRLRHHVSGYDLSLLAAALHEPAGVAGFSGANTSLERRYTIGGDISGELLGLGIWAEATWSDHDGNQWTEATLGTNYTLENGTLLMMEGFFNGRGKWKSPYDIDRWFGRFFGGARSLGKVMVYGHASRLFGQLWTLGMSGLANVGDGSMVLIPSVAYAFAQDVDILFNALLYLGPDGTEFGADRYGGFLRVRVYF